MRIAFIGTGIMGSPIAGHLLKSGHQLTVWNRTAAKVTALVERGATSATDPASAVKDSEVIFSMLMDDASLEEVVLGNNGFLDSLPVGAIHVSLSTISVQLSERLAVEHSVRKREFVAAPVFGRPNIAEAGKLWTIAAGKPLALEKVRPLLETFSRGITIAGEKPAKAHALKLGGNFLITAMIAALAEGFIYAESQSIDPALYAEAINSALFQSPFYAAYAGVMLHPPEKVGAPLAIGVKDTGLFLEAASATNTSTPLAEYFQQQMLAACEAGLQDRDWAAGYYQFVRSISHKSNESAGVR